LNELAVNFIPMLIIPLPSSANHHQFYNAQYYQNLGGAVVLEQTSLNSSQLKTTILNLIDSSKLKTMRQSLSKITPINAASKIARIILNYY
jgi:UDP-N-acetylglucosamine--N-acetylmuramyl-(pentapeptide) pyrophosphoryl-undecaprenol N-acetylglucosamine transferase